MFGRSVTLFRVFGFAVRVDPSWIVIAVLVVWSLAGTVFPAGAAGLSGTQYLVMGVAGALGLFLSIVFHELSHSLVARKVGLEMRGITLFIFGGVAEMDDEPPDARAEFLMAAAGPLASIVLAILFGAAALLGGGPLDGAGRGPVRTVLIYLAQINLMLAVFNLIPAFPLDGGRILRAILWRWKKDLRTATRISSRIGAGFGVVLVLIGVLNVLSGRFVPGMWWFLIGMFLQGAARASYQQILTRQYLEGEQVVRFMSADPVTVPSDLSVRSLMEDTLVRHPYKFYPVVEDGGRLVGCVDVRALRAIPREEWDRHTVMEAADVCSCDNTIGPQDDAVRALSVMSRTGQSRLLVTEGDHLLGVISLKDLLRFLSLKVELES